MRKLVVYVLSTLTSLAFFVSVSSVNSPSFAIFYQPKVPKELEKYRK